MKTSLLILYLFQVTVDFYACCFPRNSAHCFDALIKSIKQAKNLADFLLLKFSVASNYFFTRLKMKEMHAAILNESLAPNKLDQVIRPKP